MGGVPYPVGAGPERPKGRVCPQPPSCDLVTRDMALRPQVELAILAKGTQGALGSDGGFRTCQRARLNKASRVSGERADNHGDCRAPHARKA